MRALLPRRLHRPAIFLIAGLAVVSAVLAQRGFGGGGQIYVPPNARTAREIGTRSTGTPEWENPRGFTTEVFTSKLKVQGKVSI